MLKKFILLMSLCCSSLSAMELSDENIESILVKSAKVFDTLPFSLLKLPKNSQDEYIFSFCVSDKGQWGIAPFDKSQGYGFNQATDEIEEINCEINTISEELIKFSMQIFKINQQKETQWSVKRYRPCYSKRTRRGTVSICHNLPVCPDCQSKGYSLFDWIYNLSLPAAVLSIGLHIWIGFVSRYGSVVRECPKCHHEWLPN
ncbi:hypothetical protein [Endozoicomonas euniceicola]|uniref:LITAF domain-containing protein n=1 Tax=Endozoicomonas euniceicola TaxID=1234143 RepID=A0ABY6GWP4_9GAMM|nr:hypothetical protein [Endozoicomonas euniceicola]UYM17189.1 hypothetical protein NX720_04495 [Endozoicomonas euniceicola]